MASNDPTINAAFVFNTAFALRLASRTAVSAMSIPFSRARCVPRPSESAPTPAAEISRNITESDRKIDKYRRNSEFVTKPYVSSPAGSLSP